MADDLDRQLGVALRRIAEARDDAGEWPLDIFIKRHGANRAAELEGAVHEIERCKHREKKHEERASTAGLIAMGAAIVLISAVGSALDADSFRGFSSLTQSYVFWVAIVAFGNALVFRYRARRKALREFWKASEIGQTHFRPLGVFYDPRSKLVYRDRSP